MSTPNHDSLRSGADAEQNLRIVTIVCPKAVLDACAGVDIRGIDAIALGRAFVGGYLLMASAKRGQERLRMQIAGEGQIGQIMVDVHGDGRGRAAVQSPLPSGHPLHILADEKPRPVVAPVVGLPGSVTLTRDLAMTRRYQGHVDLQSAEIDEDLQAYLAESEQVASALSAAVCLDEQGRVSGAVGILVQALPGTDVSEIEAVRKRLGDGTLYKALAHNPSHNDLAALALGVASGEAKLGPQQEIPVRFECNCGPQRARRVLASLGADDLDALADEQPVTEIKCNFCGRVTEVSADAVREVAAEIRKRAN